MLLKAALNGSRAIQECENIPISPEQLVQDVESVVAQDISVIHIHPRSNDGIESLIGDDITASVAAIRKIFPDILIGVSTGEWIVPNLNERLNAVSEWGAPYVKIVDFASVNFSEPGAAEIANQLLKLDIGVEAGLFNVDAVNSFVKSGMTESCLRIMFEPEDTDLASAIANIDAIEKGLDSHHIVNTPRLLHGFNTTTWPLLLEAKKRGYDTRIGFEDTLFLPDGTSAKNNAVLVEAAKQILF